MQVLSRIAAIAGVVALTLTTSAVAFADSGHDDHRSDITGHVYVNNNTAGANSVSGFNRHKDGSLTPLAGSPFNAGGAGTGASIGSQGSLQMTKHGRFILAVDAASNEISVLRVEHDGALALVGSPVSSGGIRPVSLAVSKHLVYVANAGPGGSNYTGFRLTENGHLLPIAGSTFALPDDAGPGDILFDKDGDNLIGMRVGPNAGPSYIDSFKVGHDGKLTPAAGSPFPSSHIGPFGSVFSPTHRGQLFVTNAHDGAGKGSVSSYKVNEAGVVTEVAGSPVANGQTGTCWAEISRDGKFLYAINTGTNTISSYGISATGDLTLLTNTPISGTGLRAFDARLDPSGRYLYVVESGKSAVAAFAVNGGTLTELSGSAFALPGAISNSSFGIVTN